MPKYRSISSGKHITIEYSSAIFQHKMAETGNVNDPRAFCDMSDQSYNFLYIISLGEIMWFSFMRPNWFQLSKLGNEITCVPLRVNFGWKFISWRWFHTDDSETSVYSTTSRPSRPWFSWALLSSQKNFNVILTKKAVKALTSLSAYHEKMFAFSFYMFIYRYIRGLGIK